MVQCETDARHGAGETVGLDLDHGTEGAMVEGALLLELDVGQGFRKST